MIQSMINGTTTHRLHNLQHQLLDEGEDERKGGQPQGHRQHSKHLAGKAAVDLRHASAQ